MDLAWHFRFFWLRFRRKLSTFPRYFRWRSVLALVTTLSLVLGTFWALHSWNIVCTSAKINHYIDYICTQYKNGLIVGDLCDDLCLRSDEDDLNRLNRLNRIRPDSCQTMHSGKEVVFSANWKDKEIFVKGHYLDLQHEDINKIYLNDETKMDGMKIYPSLRDFEETIRHYLKDNLGIYLPTTDSLFTALWDTPMLPPADSGKAADIYQLTNYQHVAMDTLWALVQSNEYVYGRLYKRYDVFPEVYGTCGGLYAVERVRPLPQPSVWPGTSTSFLDFAARARHSLRVLDLLEEFDTIFEEPLFVCDGKKEHFGVSQFDRVKLLDSDSVMMKSVLERLLGPDTNCSSHEDCSFFDCKGRCDLIQGVCSGEIANDNLQIVCKKVFHLNHILRPGILNSKHLNSNLKETLEECANPGGLGAMARMSAGIRVKQKLVKYLQEVLNIADKLQEL